MIAAKYIKNYFPASDKEPVVDMVNRINKVMYRTFEKYDWINPITKYVYSHFELPRVENVNRFWAHAFDVH